MPRKKHPSKASSSPPTAGQISDDDMQRYMEMYDDPGMTDEQKRQIIAAMYGIVQNFVDRAWGDDPVQQAAIAERERHRAKS
jgi:hypothetical protein